MACGTSPLFIYFIARAFCQILDINSDLEINFGMLPQLSASGRKLSKVTLPEYRTGVKLLLCPDL